MSKLKILSISRPGGDRGPAVGFQNHFSALNQGDFEILEINQRIWDSDDLMKSFDIAWAYVRFHPQIVKRCHDLGMHFLGGPNIALERADIGITDEWERWYLQQSNIKMNINVAEYYASRVQEFANRSMKCRTLEYCYESDDIVDLSKNDKKNDVLIYVKDRVNDRQTSSRVDSLIKKIKKHNLKFEIIEYGSHTRADYIKACSQSKTCAWISIEDYCSLAQIESQLAGCCVIGTPYNNTIPVFSEAINYDSQVMNQWIEWSPDDKVAQSYLESINRVLSISNLSKTVSEVTQERHSYKKYRSKTSELCEEIINEK